MADECWIGKDLEGSGHDPSGVLFQHLPGWIGKPRELGQNSWCHSRDSNRAPPECKSISLCPDQTVWYEVLMPSVSKHILYVLCFSTSLQLLSPSCYSLYVYTCLYSYFQITKHCGWAGSTPALQSYRSKVQISTQRPSVLSEVFLSPSKQILR